MFKKGIGMFSMGKTISVQFETLSPTATRLSVTATTYALFDYGRSKRAAHHLLDAVGAEYSKPS